MPRKAGYVQATLAERFYDKCSPEPNSGCWLWTGAVKELGYGVMGRGGRKDGIVKAHRASWEIHNGPIPDGMAVCHKCDVPSCVNPDHLFLGTLSDNMRDCVAKGRLRTPDNRGERAGWAKLNADAVRDIRTRAHTGKSYALKYGVSKSTVFAVWSGNNWASV